jgi:hypothetical protein
MWNEARINKMTHHETDHLYEQVLFDKSFPIADVDEVKRYCKRKREERSKGEEKMHKPCNYSC